MPDRLQRPPKHWDHLKGGFSLRDYAKEGVPRNVEQPQEEASKGPLQSSRHFIVILVPGADPEDQQALLTVHLPVLTLL